MTNHGPFELVELCQELGVNLRPSVTALAHEVDGLFDVSLRYHIEPTLPCPGRFNVLNETPTILVTFDATEPVIAHELLHADLFGRGFRAPKVSVQCNERDLPLLERVHASLANAIEHRMMFPRFVSLGLDGKQFVGYNDGDPTRIIQRVKARRDPHNVILRAFAATLYVDLSAEYAFSEQAAQQLVASLRNDVYQLFTICQALQSHLNNSVVSTPDEYVHVFLECFRLLGVSLITDS